MDLRIKTTFLDAVYNIYDQFIEEKELACKRRCSYCCTIDVTVTTLEGYKIINYIMNSEKTELMEKIKSCSSDAGFQPKITTNEMAKLCANGEEMPEEGEPSGYGARICPLLEKNECLIYPVRPFACRSFVSDHNCGEKGYAHIDDFTITVNNFMLQNIEHLDLGGHTGNLTDVLIYLFSEKNLKSYMLGELNDHCGNLIANHPIEILAIPPDHHDKIGPIIEKLQNIRVSPCKK